MIYSTTLRLYLCKGIFCKEGKHEDAEEQETCASCCGRTFSLCASRRRFCSYGIMYGKNAEENEKQIVSDEVAEIESLNSRDNVVDLEELFEGEKASGKEDVTSEKTEKKEDSSTKSGSSQKSDSSKQSGGAKNRSSFWQTFYGVSAELGWKFD